MKLYNSKVKIQESSLVAKSKCTTKEFGGEHALTKVCKVRTWISLIPLNRALKVEIVINVFEVQLYITSSFDIKIPKEVTLGEGMKRWKSLGTKRIAMFTRVYTNNWG